MAIIFDDLEHNSVEKSLENVSTHLSDVVDNAETITLHLASIAESLQRIATALESDR